MTKDIKQKWKKPKVVYRLTAKEFNADDEWIDDILETELNADVMTDYYAHYNWLFGDWDIVNVQCLEIGCWADVRQTGRWREFYTLYKCGEDLHV